MSPPPSASVRPVLYGSSFAVQHAVQIANLGRKKGRKEGREQGHERESDGFVTSLALKTFGRSILPFPSPMPMPTEGVAFRRRCGSFPLQPDDAVIIGVEGASERRGVEGCAFCSAPLRVPVSPSHWFYGYKWRRCRRSGESRARGVSRVCPTIRLRSSRLWSPDAPFLSSNPL